MGHWISWGITLAMMIAINAFMYHNMTKYRRGMDTRQRIGPFLCTLIAAPLIMADLTRHILSDTNVWPWCGDNEMFPRINQTWTDDCTWSSTQYKCDMVCCVTEEDWGHSVGIEAFPADDQQACECNDCVHHETMSHLSMIGWLFTIIFTYTGFIFLASGVMWNANILKKLKVIRQTWRELREAAAGNRQARHSINQDDSDDDVAYD